MKNKLASTIPTIYLLLAAAFVASTGCRPKAVDKSASNPPTASQSVESAADETEVQPNVTARAKATVADTVYTAGRIYTVNKDQPWAEAVAIKDGKFIKVGSANDVKPLIGDDTEVVDLNGGFAMPGIGDSHIHPALLMHKRAFCALPGTFEDPTEDQIIAKLKEAIADYPKDKEWFIGHGFTTPALSKETLTREFLDKLIPDRPAWIEDESGHTGWFNTKAMEAAGVTKDFKDTPEEFFSRTEDGDLSGVAYEGAMNPFLDALPPFDTSIKKIGFTRLMDEALSKGITAFGDGYVFEQDLRAYHELYFEGKIRQHVVLYLKGNLGTPQLTPIETLEEWWSKYKLPGRKAVKLGMGGALESRSEALVDGYAPESKATVEESIIPGDQVDETAENSGGNARPVIPADQFADYMAKLDEAGFQVKVHAIGDGAVRATIDGYEKVIKANGNNRLRHHIDHCSLVHPDDFARLVDNDISITLWSVLNAPVKYNLDNIKPVLPPETWKRMYANRERVDAGIRLVQHTDAPAAVLWPWWGMEAAITRAIPGKPEAGKLGEEHALTLEEVIEAYTINVAWSLHYDDVTGSIEEGKFADMIILNHNLFEIPTTDIHKTEVQQTIFKGIVVYDAASADDDNQAASDIEADTVYTNGKIYTVNEDQPWAEATAIKDGRFIKVGSADEVKPLIGDDTELVDLGKKFMMPGFTDAHIHPVLVYIQEEAGNLLMDATTSDEVKEKLLAFAEANPDKEWIRAEKFRFGAFPGGKTNRQWLDAIIKDRPVLLYDESGHNAVANSKALELAGISKDTPNPEGGTIEKDAETGQPTGYLSETAISLVGKLLPRIDQPATKRAIERSFEEIRALGITSFVDMFAYRGSLEAYRAIEAEGRMTFRISAAVALNDYTDEYDTVEAAAKTHSQAADFDTRLVKVDSFKYWADGTPLSHTSLLLENYADRPTKGNHTLSPKQLARARELFDEGRIGRFHSIADGTTRVLLDLVEASRKAKPENGQLAHLGHLLIVHPDDIPRFKQLNVIAEFSPAFWFPLPVNDILPKYVGDRAKRAMPIAEFHNAGATVVIGSDWPAGTPTADPFRGLEGLVTRMDPWGEYPGKLGESVSLQDAIAMMTLNGTKAMGMDENIGSIEVGKHADMIVLDQNLFDLESEGRLDRISQTNVLRTIFNGKVVYDAMKDPKPKTRKAH